MVRVQELKNCSQDVEWYKVKICDKDSPRWEILQDIRQYFQRNYELTFVHFQNDCVCFKQTYEFSQKRLLLYKELNDFSNVYSNFIIHGDKFLYVPDNEWKSFGNMFPENNGRRLQLSFQEKGKRFFSNEYEQTREFECPQQIVSLPSYQTWDQSRHDLRYNLMPSALIRRTCTVVYCLNDYSGEKQSCWFVDYPRIPCDQRDSVPSHNGRISKKISSDWYGAENACIPFDRITHDKRTEPGDDMTVSSTNMAKFGERALRSTMMEISGGVALINTKKAKYEYMVLMLTKMAKSDGMFLVVAKKVQSGGMVLMLTRIVPHENMDIICMNLNITDIALSVIKGLFPVQSVNMMVLLKKCEQDINNTLMLTGSDQEVSLPNTPNEVESFSKILLDGPKANRHIQRPEKNIERSLINREDHVSVVDSSLPKVKKSRKAVSKKYGFGVKIKHALCGTGKGKCAKDRSVLGEQNKYLNKMPLRNRFLKKRDKWKKKRRRIDTKTQRKRLKPLKQQKGWSWNYYENLNLKYLKDEENDLTQVKKKDKMDISQNIRELTRLSSGEHYSIIDVWPASRENGRNEDTADQASNHAQNQLEQSGREGEPHSIVIQHPSQRELDGVHTTQQLGDQIQENSRIGIRTQESNTDAAASDLPMPNINAGQLSRQESSTDAVTSDLPVPHIPRISTSQATRSSSETFTYGELGVRERLPHQRNRRPDGNFQDSRPVGNIQESRPVGDIQNIRSVGNIQESRPVGNIQYIRSVGNIRNIRPVGNIRNIRPVGNIQESRPVGNIQESRPVGNIQDRRQVANIRNSRSVGDIQNIRSDGNIRDSNAQNRRPTGNSHQILDIIEENRRLTEMVKCIICKRNDRNILFLPCCHLVTCEQCSENLRSCPNCRERIISKLKTFLC